MVNTRDVANSNNETLAASVATTVKDSVRPVSPFVAVENYQCDNVGDQSLIPVKIAAPILTDIFPGPSHSYVLAAASVQLTFNLIKTSIVYQTKFIRCKC